MRGGRGGAKPKERGREELPWFVHKNTLEERGPPNQMEEALTSLLSGGLKREPVRGTRVSHAMFTDRQQEILDFIREQQQMRGVTPSTAEIQEHFGFASPNAVTEHLQALERKGVLQREPNKARGLVLADSYRDRAMVEIPIYGTIPAGLPADERQQPDGCISVDVETLRLPKGARVFALKVRGDSMIGAGILSGDVVVLEFREARNNGSWRRSSTARRRSNATSCSAANRFLKAENPRFPNLIPAQELVIQGVQVALLRVLKP